MITNLTIAVWNGWEIYDPRRLIAYRRLSKILRAALVRKKMQKSKIIAKITLIIRAATRDTKRASECHWIQIWVILGNRQKATPFRKKSFSPFFEKLQILTPKFFWKFQFRVASEIIKILPNGINTFSRERIFPPKCWMVHRRVARSSKFYLLRDPVVVVAG